MEFWQLIHPFLSWVYIVCVTKLFENSGVFSSLAPCCQHGLCKENFLKDFKEPGVSCDESATSRCSTAELKISQMNKLHLFFYTKMHKISKIQSYQRDSLKSSLKIEHNYIRQTGEIQRSFWEDWYSLVLKNEFCTDFIFSYFYKGLMMQVKSFLQEEKKGLAWRWKKSCLSCFDSRIHMNLCGRRRGWMQVSYLLSKASSTNPSIHSYIFLESMALPDAAS